MIFSEYNKHINRPIKVLGVSFMDFIIIVASLMGVMFITGALETPLILNLIIALAHVGALVYLRFANKQDHPTYLLSMLSFLAFQPRYITFKSPRPVYGKTKKHTSKPI